MSSDPSTRADHESEMDPVTWILRLVAAKPTPRLPSEEVREELRALVEPRWQERAACATADPEAWFPEKGSVRQVTRICAACPVNRSCLAVAMLWDEDGTWAGTNPGERTKGYRLLRRGVSVAAVVELLLTQQKPRRSGTCGRSGKASPLRSAPDPRELPRDGGSGGQEAA